MRVFISWSKPFSHAIADALHRWLPQVLQTVDPFLSAADIDPGTRWSTTIADALQTSKVGLICVTRENRHEPWLNFEAGALAKTVDEGDVLAIPLLIDLVPTDLDGPLVQFQAIKTLDREGVGHVVRTINSSAEQPLQDVRLQEAFDVWWPRLDTEIAAIRERHQTTPPAAPLRDQRELLEEILTLVRRLADGDDEEKRRRVEAIVQAATRMKPASAPGLEPPRPLRTRAEREQAIRRRAKQLGLRARGVTLRVDGSAVVSLVAPVDAAAVVKLTAYAEQIGVSLTWSEAPGEDASS